MEKTDLWQFLSISPSSTNLTLKKTFFFSLSFFLATPCGLWDPSSLTRDRTGALGSKSMESQPLDLQGIPRVDSFDENRSIVLHNGPQCGFVWCFLMIRLRLYIWGRNPKCPSWCIVLRGTCCQFVLSLVVWTWTTRSRCDLPGPSAQEKLLSVLWRGA